VDPAHEHAYTRWAAEFPDVYSGWLAENDARLTSPGASREWSALKQVLPGLGEPGALPDMPVAVLTAGRPVTAGGVFTQEFVEAFPNIWYEAHEMLVQSASRGAHILAEQSSHQIHQDQPQLVIDAIAQVVEAVR
jgi:hypothetical protein